jgi:hypothetical protein
MDFPHVFIINMAKRTDRKEKMIKLMNDLDITDYEFVTPVPLDEIKELPKGSSISKENLSLNLTITQKIIPNAKGNFIILEDDLMCMIDAKKVKSVIMRLINKAPADWNMIYMEYCFEKCGLATKIDDTGPEVQLKKAFKPYCAASIIFNYNRIKDVFDCIETEQKPMSFTYSTCIRDQRINAYISYPPIFAQDVKMQGDLKHTDSIFKLHFWLDKLLYMYDPNPAKSYPRLPACADSLEMLSYVRWYNIFWLIIFIIAFFMLVNTSYRKDVIKNFSKKMKFFKK